MEKYTYSMNLTLDDDTWKKAAAVAGLAGFTISEVLEMFLNDLTDSEESNGADERNLATEYFNRATLKELLYPDSSFLTWLIEEQKQDDFALSYGNLHCDHETPLEPEEKEEDFQFISNLYNSYVEDYTKKNSMSRRKYKIESKENAFENSHKWAIERYLLLTNSDITE